MATIYTVHGRDGPRLRTESAYVAEAHSRIGLRVTARTGAYDGEESTRQTRERTGRR
jgi:hypothetical protein